MKKRTGEKIGWIGGWLGGFIWVFILAVILLLQKRMAEGISGMALGVMAGFLISFTAPWKHPRSAYWRLMLPVFLVFIGAVAWALWAFGGVEKSGFGRWNIFWISPLLIPFFSMGKRRWEEGDN
ncbi:MAG: hypothetical protein JXB45_00220 [Candidatus Krumholzibacteriota bacterium]|nr:hypothetical protein [Candidatus Krumholzibacteriota bacterium]